MFLGVTIGVIALMFAAVGINYAAQSQGGGGGFSFPPTPVAVETAEPRVFREVIETIGTAQANESVTVTANVTEIVRALRFESGAVVEQGQILAELTSEEETADLRDARARVAEAERAYERAQDLQARGAVSASSLDQALAERDRARAQVSAIEARLADRLIRAPFAGIVGLRLVSPGSLVRPGDAIATLDDISRIKLDFTVSERYIAVVRPGVKLRAQAAAYPERIFEGEVSSVDTRVDPSTRSVRVRAILDNPDLLLRPGMLMGVAVTIGEKESLAVPELSVVAAGQRNFVYVIEQGGEGPPTASARDVVLGVRQDGYVEIVSGLSGGELVVSEGVHRLRSGAPVILPPTGDQVSQNGVRPERS